MTKKRVICPECQYVYTIQYGIQAKTTGVRSKPGARKGEMNYEITVPEHVSSESVRFSGIRDDLIGAAILGVLGGGTCGLIIAPLFPGYEGQAVIIGAAIATTYAWGCLQAETNQRLKRVLPSFLERRAAWQAGKAEANQDVHLTVDHRYRDGNTEAGRTIEYFGSLPVDVERFNRWAVAVLGGNGVPGETLAHTAWVGLKRGKLFSRTEYEPLLAHLAAGGTVINLPGKGHVLTGGGRRALRQHLKTHPPTALKGLRDA